MGAMLIRNGEQNLGINGSFLKWCFVEVEDLDMTKGPVLPPHLGSVHICWGLCVGLRQHWHHWEIKSYKLEIELLFKTVHKLLNTWQKYFLYALNWTPSLTTAFISKGVGPRGVQDAYTHLRRHYFFKRGRNIFIENHNLSYPAIWVDIRVEEIWFEPETMLLYFLRLTRVVLIPRTLIKTYFIFGGLRG